MNKDYKYIFLYTTITKITIKNREYAVLLLICTTTDSPYDPFITKTFQNKFEKPTLLYRYKVKTNEIGRKIPRILRKCDRYLKFKQSSKYTLNLRRNHAIATKLLNGESVDYFVLNFKFLN